MISVCFTEQRKWAEMWCDSPLMAGSLKAQVSMRGLVSSTSKPTCSFSAMPHQTFLQPNWNKHAFLTSFRGWWKNWVGTRKELRAEASTECALVNLSCVPWEKGASAVFPVFPLQTETWQALVRWTWGRWAAFMCLFSFWLWIKKTSTLGTAWAQQSTGLGNEATWHWWMELGGQHREIRTVYTSCHEHRVQCVPLFVSTGIPPALWNTFLHAKDKK